MEHHRANATLAASKKRKNRRDQLKFYISRWPATMTTKDYNYHLDLLASLTARSRSSVARFIRRWEYVCFDTNTMLWKNRICNDVVE
jgi:hypothetical protein